jgi:hypothetical protein
MGLERAPGRRRIPFRSLLVLIPSLLFASDAPARGLSQAADAVETPLQAAPREGRSAAWAEALAPIDVSSMHGATRMKWRLYGADGDVDEEERAQFEQFVAGDGEPHALERRLEQLVVKAAYHFHDGAIVVVSGWRAHSGRHTACQALDFKLAGVRAATLASYLRSLPRVGVGIYTHPRTQFVHLDVRDVSYHWIDASPPGISWKERQIRDPGQMKRDLGWSPEGDLPFD